MTLASWLDGASRRVKKTFNELVSSGARSEKRAAKLIKLVERASASEFKPVPASKRARYFLPSAPKTAPTISRTEFIKRKYGASPRVLAAERNAGLRSYKSAASEEQAAKQIAIRESRRKQLALRHYGEEPANPIVYQNTNGAIVYDYFWKKNLVTMHLYRDAYDHALYSGDGAELKKFKDRIIISYDGPGLRNYHNKGARVYPETDLKKIMAKRASMTARDRARFDADRNYRKLELAA